MQHPSTQATYTDGWRDLMNGRDHAPTNDPHYKLGWRDASYRIYLAMLADHCNMLSLAQPQVV